MKALALPLAVAMVAGCALVVGCGPEKTVTLRYERPAEYQIPTTIRRVAIAEFGGQTPQDRRWGELASDRLAADLDAYNRRFNRYELVDRRRLKAIMDERDLQIAISDTDTAGKVGKLANVEAMIYGTARVTTRDEHATRTVFDPIRRGTKTVPYTKRYCLASVGFTMDDIGSGKTLAAAATTREYDSEKDRQSGSAGIARALGFGGDDLPPSDQVVTRLVEECVQEFLRKVSPHEIVVTEKLQRGKGKVVDTGNKLALAGDHAGALECYQRAMQAEAGDHGAAFNAGLMQEALRRFKEAEALYDQAFKIEPKDEYVRARQRVRQEGKD